jgi:hypothetical protein
MNTEHHDTEHHARVWNGNFHPFNEISGDFDLDAFARQLRLRHLQKELLRELLKQLEIKIWFWSKHESEDISDHRRDSPGFEINVFWQDLFVGSANLFHLLEKPFESEWNEIGYEHEIVALNKLKTMIDNAIELRQQKLGEQSADENASHGSSVGD